MTTLVTGARGQVGQGVIARLHAAGRPVRAASAHPAGPAVPDGVETVRLDLGRPEGLDTALRGVDQVFLYPDPAGIHAFIKAAEAAGVTHVVLLSSASVLGPDAETDPLAHHSLTVERALAGSRLTHTFLRADSFASNSLAWAHAIGGGLPVQLAHPDAHLAPVHPDDIADIAFAALTGDLLTGRALTLTGPESLTFREQLAALSEVLGRPVTVEHTSRAEAERQMSRFMPAPVVASLLDYWAAACHGPATVADTTETLLGRPARTYRQWARDHADAFAAQH
ncbi:NAD(P)H-binding protein [Streptomyces sp. NPDC053493]|uniref:NAD(P)H-binding protein n=1 Tax=Streptomyces sp. NPDC053493 TaxID=3365705 RepID=UPI0037CE3764